MNIKKAIDSIRDRFTGTLESDAPLSKYAYYRIGGPAKVVATPKTLEDLNLLNKVMVETGAPFFILGWGSNLLFSDEGYPGIIIRMKQLFTEADVDAPGVLKVGASMGCSSLLRKAQEKGWGKLAHFTGIPGSVGGMVAMNAGTHIGEMKDSLISVEYISLGKSSGSTLDSGTQPESRLVPLTYTPTEKSFSYRHNHFLAKNDLILSVRLRFTPEDPAKVKDEIDALYQRRKQTQPVDFPSCGSVFMNPKESGFHAWQVIDKLGLRGKIQGGAQISEKHPNFIINLGNAKASDVKVLIELIKTRAQNELGIVLQEEVKIL